MVWFRRRFSLRRHTARSKHNDHTAVPKFAIGRDYVRPSGLTRANKQDPSTGDLGDTSVSAPPPNVLRYTKIAETIIHGRADLYRVAQSERVNAWCDYDVRDSCTFRSLERCRAEVCGQFHLTVLGRCR